MGETHDEDSTTSASQQWGGSTPPQAIPPTASTSQGLPSQSPNTNPKANVADPEEEAIKAKFVANPIVKAIGDLFSREDKKEIPTYKGKGTDKLITEWLKGAEHVARNNDWNDDQKIRFFSDRLKGEAFEWHENYAEEEEAIIARFQETVDLATLEKKLSKLKQKPEENCRAFVSRQNNLHDITEGKEEKSDHNTTISILSQHNGDIKKCEFFKEELDYLGYIVSRKGITPNKKLLEAIIKYPAPKNVKELSSFLGLASYYRKFIRAFADKAHPLIALTKKSAEWKWGEEQRDAFDCIKNCLITRPILGYPDFSREFIIYTDASGYGIGAVLAQVQTPPQSADFAESDEQELRESDGVEVAKWSTTEKEAYAIIHAIEVFRTYLYGRRFTVYTDHRPLEWLMSKTEPGGRLARWALKIQEFDIVIGASSKNRNKLQTSLSSIQTILITLCLLQYINPTHPIYATVCDCNNVKIRGILDLESPYYCNNDAMEKQHSTSRIPTSYTLITNQKPAATWRGWTCRQWTKTKKITGSFWIGSFDTIYSQETKLITPLECWRMVNDKKCGENNMQTGPTSISFTATPTGEGKLYAIKEYHTLNCIAEQITLRQERPDQPIESPFGLLNTTQQEGQYFINQNVIVWGERTTNHSFSQTLLKGKGYLEIPRTPEINNSSRLYDDIRQIEISFLNKPDKDVAATGFKVTGIPLTYLTFPAETTKILYETFKATINICLKNTNLITSVYEEYRDLHKSRPQRSLLQEVKFLFNTPIKDEQLGIRLYSISYAWGTIRLVHKKAKVIYEEGKISQQNATLYQPGNSNSLTTYPQLSADEVLPSGTEFEYTVDDTITIQNSNICITETTNNHVFAATCSEDSTKWILEKDNFYIISQESEMCLTLVSDEILKLEQCSMEEESLRNQQWYFQTINTNPEIVENFPDITLQEIREVKMEQRKTITTTINSPIFGGILKTNHGTGNIIWDMIAWGLLKNGQHPNEKCVTHHGLDKPLTLEDCDTDWTKCQEELKEYITSNDPLVKTQVSVGNCSRANEKGQAFEYTSDFTIRPFNTNNCIKANTTMLVLQKCANTSSIWGTFEHTGQLMATDRTGLHSPASDRKCLTLKVGRLSLGHCRGATSIKQQFSFEYWNPHQVRTLSAAAIMALSVQQPLDGKQLPSIPPLLKREEKLNNETRSTTALTTSSFEIIEDNEHPIQQEKPEAASLTLEKVPEKPTQEISQTKEKIPENEENGLPKNINEFEEKVTFQINKLHEQYKIRIETEHENKLAKEIRDVYCQLSTIKRNQAVILAQGNGILAASTIGLPICSRLQGSGQTLSLQQCEAKRIFVSAKETKCGYQPFFTYEDKNCTIGIDGWSIHPYSDCSWKTQ
ncbi:hypothetical protein GHT06_016955 [Daphnia sinensis]|uniref:RNA-directed DNA polymerase n=1 Tax=Daphnia sinensis TaxID=1820382 RepID=A0AAD5LGD9_9CRUS|nr:hypothetical protein GHT06_016955 [Daphnia sinensis]